LTESIQILKLKSVLSVDNIMQTMLNISIDTCIHKPFQAGEVVRIPAGIIYKNKAGDMVTTKKPKLGTISGFATCDIQSYEVVFYGRTLLHGCIIPGNLLHAI
jgi:hypothetical protein